VQLLIILKLSVLSTTRGQKAESFDIFTL